ncbi:MAG TPA: helix-turn-helix domain-containing protein [Micromonosporaceae bacterium]
MIETPSPSTPQIRTRLDFATELTAVRERAGLTIRDVAKASGLQASTVGGYFSGRHLPPLKPPDVLANILRACGVSDRATILAWEEALRRIRRSPGRRPAMKAPYRGLAGFQPDDADWFFGRDALTKTLVDRVEMAIEERRRVLLVVGPSGAGKSSLLRAGLVARLRSDAGGAAYDCRLLTPGPHPMESLTSALSSGERTCTGDGRSSFRPDRGWLYCS